MDLMPNPITIAVVDDYDVVVLGVARMLEQYPERVQVAELSTTQTVDRPVDIVLYDAFAQPETDAADLQQFLDNPLAGRTVVYTWNFQAQLVEQVQKLGLHGYLSKALPARDLVSSLERIHGGEVVISDPPGRARSATGLDWPGRGEGLSDRESEILALITQGKSNADVAAITFLSPNTIKSYVRTIYRKIGVGSRTQAVLWGVRHGFSPDHSQMRR
ncbi:helix-turn-helix transcriptional regulator [Microlunatus antarcticus]|uniref:DNA-binding NarL/FixJ family response regulator n=1 Tax=Microlunatus antarcticus TaxID=53388 RepID=A0A7W5JS26_9ACTN|nr:response regulator transcription factor [Microlunatus antarcticus]MBB3325158.1 DNA-binding NarL/FixJ family response regulator [Microlunatus antarcticus]